MEASAAVLKKKMANFLSANNSDRLGKVLCFDPEAKGCYSKTTGKLLQTQKSDSS